MSKEPKAKKPIHTVIPRNMPRRCDGFATSWDGSCLACDSLKGGKCLAPKKKPKAVKAK